jgi:hypothetical protein
MMPGGEKFLPLRTPLPAGAGDASMCGWGGIFMKYPDLKDTFINDLLTHQERMRQIMADDPGFIEGLEAMGIELKDLGN